MFDSNPNDFLQPRTKHDTRKNSLTTKQRVNKYKSTTLSFVHQLQKLHKSI